MLLSNSQHEEYPIRVINPPSFTGKTVWQALDIEQIGTASIRLHWTNQPYKWHINDGPEVFVVLDDAVDMHARQNGVEQVQPLALGVIFHAEQGDEHVAHPCGVARVLVIEHAGSV